MREPLSRQCCKTNELRLVRALHCIPLKSLCRPVELLHSELGNLLPISQVKQGILAQGVGWLAALQPPDLMSKLDTASPVLLTQHRKLNHVRPKPKSKPAVDYLMTMPNLPHAKLVQVASMLSGMSCVLSLDMPEEVAKYLALNRSPLVPQVISAKFELDDISVGICPWFNGDSSGTAKSAVDVTQMLSCKPSSIEFWSKQEFQTVLRRASVTAEEAVLFAIGEAIQTTSARRLKKRTVVNKSTRILGKLGEVKITPSQLFLDMVLFWAASNDQYRSDSVSVSVPSWAQAVRESANTRPNVSSWQSIEYFRTVFSRRMAHQQLEWQALRSMHVHPDLVREQQSGVDEADVPRHSTQQRGTGYGSVDSMDMESGTDINMDSSDDDDGEASILDNYLDGIVNQSSQLPDATQTRIPVPSDDLVLGNQSNLAAGSDAVPDERPESITPVNATESPTPKPSCSVEKTCVTFLTNNITAIWRLGSVQVAAAIEPCQFVASSEEAHSELPGSANTDGKGK